MRAINSKSSPRCASDSVPSRFRCWRAYQPGAMRLLHGTRSNHPCLPIHALASHSSSGSSHEMQHHSASSSSGSEALGTRLHLSQRSHWTHASSMELEAAAGSAEPAVCVSIGGTQGVLRAFIFCCVSAVRDDDGPSTRSTTLITDATDVGRFFRLRPCLSVVQSYSPPLM